MYVRNEVSKLKCYFQNIIVSVKHDDAYGLSVSCHNVGENG